jgi:hypothetical protein
MYGGLSRTFAGFSNAVQGTQPGEGKVSMAEVKYNEKPGELISTFIEKPGELISTFIWSGLHSGDRGEPIRNVSGNISFQIIEVSKDGTVYETATDRRRNPALAATFRHNSNQIRT